MNLLSKWELIKNVIIISEPDFISDTRVLYYHYSRDFEEKIVHQIVRNITV